MIIGVVGNAGCNLKKGIVFPVGPENIGPINFILAGKKNVTKIIEPGEWGYTKVLKLRVMQATHDELVAIQESRGVSMAQLLREMIYESMNKETY